MNYKNKFVKILIIPLILNGVVLTILAMLLANYDHLQLKQYDFYDENKFTALPDMRLQAKGIIKNVNFDSVILGSSVLANSSATQASKLLGGTFVNLSFYGGRMYERNFIFNYLLKQKTIKKVIYSLDEHLYDPKDETYQLDRWELLYDDNILNDLMVLYAKKYSIGALKYFLYPYIAYDFNIIDHVEVHHNSKPSHLSFFNSPQSWMQIKIEKARFGGLENWCKHLERQGLGELLLKKIPTVLDETKHSNKLDYNDVSIEKFKSFVNKYLLKYVRDFPDTEYYIVFPPYYRYLYASSAQTNSEKYFMHQKIVKYMVQQAEKYKNLHIYAFEELSFLNDIAKYKDVEHYSDDINRFITESIASNKHQLNLQNVDAYLAKSKELALKFDIQKLYDDSQKILREHNLPTTWEEYLARN